MLHDVRLMAMIFLANTHVVAVHRDEASVDGRVTFRKYDNHSDARRRGTFERLSARQLWVGSCEVVAIVPCNSALHRAVGAGRQGEAKPDRDMKRKEGRYFESCNGGFFFTCHTTSF